MDLKNLKRAIEQIAEEKGIEAESVKEAIESAIAAAYRKEYGGKGEIIKANLDLKSGDLKFWQAKTAVDESSVRIKKEEEKEDIQKEEKEGEEGERVPFYNPDRHIFMEEAKKIKPDVQLGEELEFPLEERTDFGRIASQAAKQVVLQRLREIERESIQSEYRKKEGEIVSGIVQRVERGNVHVDLGRVVGVMFYNEGIPGERYRIGERLRFYLLAVQEETRKAPGIVLSRAHPQFIAKLFELEVPEINDGLVEIKGIAREAGGRTKVAVASAAEGIDPIGSMVGQRGIRVMAVTNELGNEKIDIIEWSEDPAKFIAAALSPAKVKTVEVSERREAKAFIPEDQVSLAIGKNGQNVRVAAKLTGWKIDIRSLSRPEESLAEGAVEAEAAAGKSAETELLSEKPEIEQSEKED